MASVDSMAHILIYIQFFMHCSLHPERRAKITICHDAFNIADG